MKPVIDSNLGKNKSLIDASNTSLDDCNKLAACDLIDTACKKLSLASAQQRHFQTEFPTEFGLILNASHPVLLSQNNYQQQQQQNENAPQPIRKTGFYSTSGSTNVIYGLGKHRLANYKQQQEVISEKTLSNDESSKLIYHDEDSGYFPIRYIIILMSTLATFVSYTIRVNMSVTLVAMVGDGQNDNTEPLSLSASKSAISPSTTIASSHQGINSTHDISPSLLLVSSPKIDLNNLDWSESIQGVALGAFYWGFILTHVLGGQLANIFSARIICATSILTASLLTLILPMAANFSVYSVILLRMVTGLCLGIVAPALYTLSSRWVPQNERSTAIAIRMIGGNMGAVSAMSISGYLSDLINWESVFYVIGCFGCIVFLLWIYLVSDSPQQHSWMGAKELKLIQANTDCISTSQAKTIKLDWVSMLTSSQLWAVAIAKFCGSWGNLMLMQKLPTYLETVLQMPIGKNGLVNALVYISMSISLFVFGCLSDYICTKQPRSQRTTTRVLFELIALLGPAICLAFIPFCGHSQNAVITLLIVSMVLYGMTAGGDNPIVVEIAPDFPGTLYGVTNAVASIPGFMAPIIVGFMLDSNTNTNEHQWSMIFFITSGIYAVGAIAFMVMADADVQPWGLADFRKKEILEQKRRQQQQQQQQHMLDNDGYYYDYGTDSEENDDKKILLDEEAIVSNINNRRQSSVNSNNNGSSNNNRRISRFENSINLLEQHHFNIGSFNQDSMRVRNI